MRLRGSRRAGRRLVLFLAVLAVALAALLAGLYPREPVRRAVESRLRAVLGPGVSMQSLHVVPGALRASILGLVVEAPGYRLEVPRLELRLRARTLSGSGVHLASLTMVGPTLRWRADPNAPATPPPQLPALVISALDVQDATLVVELADGGGVVESRGLRARGAVGEGTLVVDAPENVWTRDAARALGALSARLALDPRLDTRLDEATLAKGESRIRAKGAIGRLIAPRLDLAFDGTLHSADFAELASAAGVRDLRGEASVSGKAAGPVADLELTVEAKGRGVGASGYLAQSLDLAADHKAGRSTAKLSAAAYEGRVEASGTLHGDAVSGRASFQGVRFEALPPTAQIPRELRGTLSGNASFEGSLQDRLAVEARLRSQATYGQALTADVTLSGSVLPKDGRLDLGFKTTAATQGGATLRAGRLKAEGGAAGAWPPSIEGTASLSADMAVGAAAEPVDAQARFRWSGAGASLELDGTFLGGRFTGNGRWAGQRLDAAKLTASSLDLARLRPDLRGSAGLDLTAAGTAVDGRLELGGLSYQAAPLGDASVALQGTSAALRWTLSAPAMRLSGRGELTTGQGGALTGTLDAERTPLAPFEALAPAAAGLDGFTTASAEIRVPLAAPARAAVDGRVTALEVRTARFGPLKVQPFSARYAAERVEVRELRAEATGAAAFLDGELSFGAGAAVSGTARAEVDLAAVEPRVEGLTGRIELDLRFGGSARRPNVTGAATLDDVAFERPDEPRVRVSGRLRFEEHAARFEGVTARLDGGALEAAGRVPLPALVPSWRADPARLRADEAADVTLRWDGFDAGELLARLRPTAENPLVARMTGSLALRGGLASLGEVEALLVSEAADLAAGDVRGRIERFEVRVADGRAASEGIQLATAGGAFKVAGSAGIASQQLDVTGRGTLDLRVLSPFLTDTALTGSADVDARVTGTRSAPDARGRLAVRDGSARFRVLAQAVTGIQAELALDRSAVRVERAAAALGGGSLGASGTIALAGLSAGAVDVALTARDVALRYPEGLRSRIDADLKLTGRPGALLLSGEARAGRALYDRDFQSSGFLAATSVSDSPLLRSIALDLGLVLGSPLRVRNDTARLEATGRMNVRGDLQSPSPFGRFEVTAPGGELILLGARYAVNRGTISYAGTWDPQIDIEVQRRIQVRPSPTDVSAVPGEYTAIIAANGTVSEILREVLQLALGGRADERTETLRFSAEGPGELDPTDVGYLALIGRRRSEVQGGRVAGEQTGILLAGQLARKLQRGLPFENITIQPELVSRETAEPDARFTFGAALADGVDLTYSQSLSTPEDKLIQLAGRTRANLTALVRREYDLEERDDFITVGAGQRFELGGARPARPRGRRRDESVVLSGVTLSGLDDPALQKEARGAIEAAAGKKATPWSVQDDGDRIRELLLKRGYVDAEVGADVDGSVARFHVRAGRPYRTRVQGMPDPPDLEGVLRASLYEEEALEKGRARILEALFGKGHWRAKVEATGRDEAGARVLAFEVEPGPVAKLTGVTFPGAAALGQPQLLRAAGGAGALIATPQPARAAVHEEYRKLHYLEAKVGAPRVVEQAGAIAIEVPVEEGRRALITEVRVEGALRPEAELRRLSRLQPGMPYDDESALLSVDAVRNDYYRAGYPHARVHASHADSPGSIVLTFHVDEGPRLTVGEVRIVGLQRVRESFVRGNVDLKPGDPVDPARLGRVERRLLALTVFSRVSSRFSDDDPSLVTLEVAERARFGAGYDVRYNETERLAGVLDGEMRNVFGRGLGLGARYQGGSTIAKWRGTVFVPSFLWRGDLQASVFHEQEEDFGEGETGVTRLQRGFQFQESVRVGARSSVLFGYRLARTRVTSPLLPFPSTQNVASLNLSGIRDTRDDVLDARTGRFVALNLTLAPAAIGSDQNFVKGLAQAFLSLPVGRRMTWAQGYRVGVARCSEASR